MATPVEMPKLGNTVEECLVSRWVRRKGEKVSAGDLVAEIETDKATFEVTAPVDGTVLATFFEEGELVPVFTNLFVIGDPGENAEEFRPGAAGAGGGAAAEAPPAAEEASAAPVWTGEAASEAAANAPWSPRARRYAAEHGLQTASLAGTGPGGRVLEADLRRLYEGGGAAAVAATAPAAAPAAGKSATGIRDKIARRMRESLATTAQYTLHGSADARGLLAVRKRIKGTAGMADININDLVAFCTIRALGEMPELNAEYIDGKIRGHAEIHLGFACDTPRGLMVPVIRDAHLKSAGELARAAKELTARAVGGTIGPDDLTGATFTISNLGGLGIEWFTPLLNPPQVAILGVGAIRLEAARTAGGVEFVDRIGLSLTCDHQVIDGAPGARFLKTLGEQIGNVEKLNGLGPY